MAKLISPAPSLLFYLLHLSLLLLSIPYSIPQSFSLDLPKCGWDGPVDLCATDTTPSDGHTEVPDKEQTFQVYFNLWQLQVPKAHPAKKGKQTAGGSRPSALKAARPTSVWPPATNSWTGFQKALGRALVAGGLTLQGYKNIHPKNKGKELIDIADGIKFTHFVTAALNAPASTVMGIKPNGCESGESDGEGLVSSEGIPGLVLLLNTSRIRTWANDWANGVRGLLIEVNPPMMRPKIQMDRHIATTRQRKNALLGLAPPKHV
ncbi:hypothetical protein DFH28DRAFT_939999 [Melampsora americana]|nr:hypothetical protein DFH28DRAFT_939999 [Melampsora americana]